MEPCAQPNLTRKCICVSPAFSRFISFSCFCCRSCSRFRPSCPVDGRVPCALVTAQHPQPPRSPTFVVTVSLNSLMADVKMADEKFEHGLDKSVVDAGDLEIPDDPKLAAKILWKLDLRYALISTVV